MFSEAELETCLRVLQQIADDPAMMQEHERFKSLVAKIHKEGKKGQRHTARQQRIAADRQARAHTIIVRQQTDLPQLPAESSPPTQLLRARNCYSCKQPYTELHPFYHMLCPVCAALNYAKRDQRADLHGRVALLTGGRIKIGYQIALRLLRDGARVLLTTRFPHDAARRFAAEPDAEEWIERLQIFSLDLRRIPAVEAFAQHLRDTEPALDILINNAAQTIKRPLAFYEAALVHERAGRAALPARAQRLVAETAAPPLLESLNDYRAPLGDGRDQIARAQLDRDGQPLDLRSLNSWVLPLDQVDTVELLEVHLVNAIGPAMLVGQLKPLLQRSPFARRFVVNVSAMEGQFARTTKTEFHPHTNMAKAALNMLTRTSAAEYARDGIYMNSVDTGWITDEKPHAQRLHVQQQRGFFTPLDLIDGAARVYDPIARGVNEADEPPFGLFLKDYQPYSW